MTPRRRQPPTPAHTLKVTRHIRDDLVSAIYRLLDPPQLERGIRIGQQLVRANTVVADVYLVVHLRRKAVALPFRRAQTAIHSKYVGIRHSIPRLKQKWRVLCHRLVFVKIDRPTVETVVILKEPDDRHVRPKLLEKRQLTPADMPHDDVGLEPLVALDLLGCNNSAKPCTRCLFPNFTQAVCILLGRVMRFIQSPINTLNLGHIFALREEIYPVDLLRRQPLYQLAVLARHVLVHKKNIHGCGAPLTDNISAPR